ncbi:MAG: hypothetical protein MRZ34_00755 [Bacillales bacterium]|nr:hypothetical protein [Bacillales bacterium]
MYESVPNIISGKDLDYLTDIFNWNYSAYKSTINMSDEITDDDLLDILKKCTNLFYDNMINTLDILERGKANE